MGQYYECVNLDKGEVVDPSDYDDGIKLMEHSWRNHDTVNVVEKLLGPNGPWYKTRMVWAGDYMDEGLFIEDIAEKLKKEIRLKELFENVECLRLINFAHRYFYTIRNTDVTKDETLRYLVNHDQRVYMDISNLPLNHTWEEPRTGKKHSYYIHPLPLLTASGNGLGMGDYKGENPYVGTWAGEILSMEQEIPEEFDEVFPDFKE